MAATVIKQATPARGGGEEAGLPTITRAFAEVLIDFAPTEETKRLGFAESQLEGTVAVFNMLARNRCAYLADEVGMGKTYVALAVMSLLRHFDPGARVVIIAPRENIQLKWGKELTNFVTHNWKPVGNRVKSLQGGPAWQPVVCGSLLDFAREALTNADRDFLLRMTSFSLALKQPEARRRLRRLLRQQIPWLSPYALSPKSPDEFRDAFGCALNAAVPEADLVIVDEGHNLKHGFDPKGSTRNRILGFAFGHPEGQAKERHWYAPKAKRILLLSATPFEEEYAAIQRQLSIFGFGDALLRDGRGEDPLPLSALTDRDLGDEEKRAVARRLMVRRVSGLKVGDEYWTKNMYRREWRKGGYQVHDEPMTLEDPKERLVVALMQKKVAEILQSEKFNNHFQIGMLSSFESFLESVSTAGRRKAREAENDEEGGSEEPTFEGEQRASVPERKGIDTSAVTRVAESYRQRFGTGLPHPKLDATAQSLSSCFETGEKTLVFVRRVATVRELAAKLDGSFDRWIRERMEGALPQMRGDVARMFELYEQERRRRPEDRFEPLALDHKEPGADAHLDERRLIDEDDEGSAETFFAWFFRGKGPEGYLSGAAFQKNRLASTSSAYATLFEDDHVAWLLGHPDDPLSAFCETLGQPREKCLPRLRERAWRHFKTRSRQAVGFPRLYVHQCYQAAALEAMAEGGGTVGERAHIVLEEAYPTFVLHGEASDPPGGFPRPEEGIGARTFITELQRRPKLRQALWPDDGPADFKGRFKRREQRRELLSGMARLGAAYIDLYCLAVEPLGSMSLRGQVESEHAAEDLAIRFADLLEQQAHESGFHAYRELSAAAENFDLLLAVNFPDVAQASLRELAALYGATLQRQVPVGHMAGGVNKRLVRQFRMPGFPLVLVTTDVLQEGEDLHTFCRRVVHYGITWTPSAMEQRTGRVDRIGSLVQRRLDGKLAAPPEELLQVHYPHLRDTVEVLQIRRVLRRLNRFLHLITKTVCQEEDRDSRIDAARALLEADEDVAPVAGQLESAFPVDPAWLDGDLRREDVRLPQLEPLAAHLERLWEGFTQRYAVEAHRDGQDYAFTATAHLIDSRIGLRKELDNCKRQAGFQVRLRSQTAGERALLRCSSDVGRIDLRDDELLDSLYDLQRELGQVKVCARRSERDKEDMVTVEGDILFDPATSDPDELETVISRVVCAAAALRSAMSLGSEAGDAEPALEHLRGVTTPEREDPGDVLAMAEKLIDKEELEWQRTGGKLDVKIGRTGRWQRVTVSRRDGICVLQSVVVPATFVTRNHAHWRRLAYRAWRKNAAKELVAFGFDEKDQLVGVIEQPVATMAVEELRFYVEMLARECDRFEYVLTGEDEG